MAKYFNSQTIDDERSIIIKCIIYQFRHSLAMKLINLCARQVERVGHVGRVPALSRVIARVSLKGLCIL